MSIHIDLQYLKAISFCLEFIGEEKRLIPKPEQGHPHEPMIRLWQGYLTRQKK